MKHLTEGDRKTLEVLRKIGWSQQSIADEIGCSQSTISRELRRNSSPKAGRYKASKATERVKNRRQKSYVGRRWYEKDPNLLEFILEQLRSKRSPDQASGRLKQQGKKCVSFQSIYLFITSDKRAGGKLYKQLRYQGKKYKWRGWPKTDKSRIPNRKGIELRPTVVDQKNRFGDWESDLVVSSKKGAGAVATFAERKSMYFQADLVVDQSSDEFLRATQKTLGKLRKHQRLTMTHDNGKEIAKHELITQTLGVEVFCARPYRSCDRGLNEFMNRELRRFFPKGTDFSQISSQELDSAVNWLNNCPRRSLGFFTPAEIFYASHS